jgi:hypothetical protein
MEWKVGKDLKIFSAYPYRVEKVRDKYKLYRYTKDPITNRWTMNLLGKFEQFEDADREAEADKKQGRLF